MNEAIIQDDLVRFATTSDVRTREQHLPHLKDLIMSTDHTLDWTPYTRNNQEQELLQAAVDKTLQTPFIFRHGKTEFLPFEGGYTLVAATRMGAIVAALSNPVGAVYDDGANKQDHATFKAALGIHTRSMDAPGGIEEYHEYLEEIMGSRVFLGDAETRLTTVTLRPLFIGLSACGLSPIYRQRILEEINPAPASYENVGAGTGDAIFGSLVAYYLDNPREPIKTELEPDKLRSLRIGN